MFLPVVPASEAAMLGEMPQWGERTSFQIWERTGGGVTHRLPTNCAGTDAVLPLTCVCF